MNNEKLIEWLEQGSISIPTLLLVNYKKLGLTENDFMVLLHVLSFIESGNSFPTPTELTNRMNVSTEDCADILRKLFQRGFITINEEFENGIIHEKYSLKPLWEKLLQLFLAEESTTKKQQTQQDEANLYIIFEKEFGRPLSPFEGESLAMWIDQDHHDPLIIKAALREAVMSGKLNFRYIDRILFEWKKNGITTIEHAQAHSRKFRQYQQKTQKQVDNNQQGDYKRSVPFYNWLEN